MGDGRLARATRADERRHGAGRHLECDAVEHWGPGNALEFGHRLERRQAHLFGTRIGEINIVEAKRHRPRRSGYGVGAFRDHRFQIEDLEQPLKTDHRRHEVNVNVGQLSERSVQTGQVCREGHHGSDREVAVKGRHATESVGKGCGERGRQRQRDEEEP